MLTDFILRKMAKLKIKTYIKLDFEVEGFHHYPNAPHPVKFLEHHHRHLFRFIIKYKVTDLNREKEIFMQQDVLKEYIGECYGYPAQFGAMSCEMIAKELLEFILDDGGVYVEVLEDGKGGAIAKI